MLQENVTLRGIKMSMTTDKPTPRFRVRIEDLDKKKHKVITVYRNKKEKSLEEFADFIRKIIPEF